MAQVPYSPVPSQVLADTPTPEMHPAIPEAAFGGQVAQAVSGFGNTLDKAGDEIFSRAIALQNLQNETDAKNADADYMIKAGKLHADYGALQGQDRVTAYPKLVQDLQQARMDTRNSLANPMAQKMYDQSALQTMGRTIFNAAGAAAVAQKEYVIGTAQAQSKLDANTVSNDPENENTFQDKLQRARHNAITIAAAKGLPEGSPQEQLLLQQQTSDLWYNRIQGLSQTSPSKANKMLEAHSDELTDDDRIKLTQVVRAQSRSVDSQNIAQEVFAGGKGDEANAPKSFSEMQAEAEAIAKQRDPNDPLLVQHTRAALQGLYNQSKYAERQEDQANIATINQALHDGVPNYQAFRADPKNAAAEDALVASGKKINIPAMINNYNTARDKQDNETRFRTIMGNANNDVLSFLDYNPYDDKQLSQGQMNQVVAKQAALKKQVNQDPQVDRAMSWLRQGNAATMQALGVYSRDRKNPDDFDHLTGTVQDAMSIWAEQHQGKQPTQKEFDEQIAPQVLKQHVTPGWFGSSVGQGRAALFTQDTSTKDYTDFAEKQKKEVTDRTGMEPTDGELYRAYVRMQLLKLYPGKAAGSE